MDRLFHLPRTQSKAKGIQDCSTKNKDQSHGKEDQESKYYFDIRLDLGSIVCNFAALVVVIFGRQLDLVRGLIMVIVASRRMKLIISRRMKLIISRRMIRMILAVGMLWFRQNISYLSVCRNSSDSTVAILVHVNRRIQISALNHAGRNRKLNIVEGASEMVASWIRVEFW